eukprot:gene41435-51308_t
MRLRLANPEKIVDLNNIPELAGIRREGNALVIGAMTRHMDVANSADVKAAIPALADLANGIGDRQVRALGTMGGSVANNDPAADYPAAVVALNATVTTNTGKHAADSFFKGLFETALGRKAVIELKPGEPGDMQETAADIESAVRDLGWSPQVTVDRGIPLFVEWFKAYNRL